MSDSKIQVAIVEDVLGDGVSLTIRIREDATYSRYMQIGENAYNDWVGVESSAGLSQSPHPTMRLTNDIARAMLDALMRHYQGSEDLRTVRADLLHERGRVDKLIATIGEISGKVVDLADTAVTN